MQSNNTRHYPFFFSPVYEAGTDIPDVPPADEAAIAASDTPQAEYETPQDMYGDVPGFPGSETPPPAQADPSFIGPDIQNISQVVDAAMTPIDTAPLFSDVAAGTQATKVGMWPSWLQLSPEGVISGTPTGLGQSAALQVSFGIATSNQFTADSVLAAQHQQGQQVAPQVPNYVPTPRK